MTTTAVTPATIDQVLSIIELHGGWARFACQTSILFLIDLEALGRAMTTMCEQASSDAGDAPVPTLARGYRWQGGYVTLVDGYRALRAFLEACDRGDSPMPALYEALEGYAGLLAAEIAGNARDE